MDKRKNPKQDYDDISVKKLSKKERYILAGLLANLIFQFTHS